MLFEGEMHECVIFLVTFGALIYTKPTSGKMFPDFKDAVFEEMKC